MTIRVLRAVDRSQAAVEGAFSAIAAIRDSLLADMDGDNHGPAIDETATTLRKLKSAIAAIKRLRKLLGKVK